MAPHTWQSDVGQQRGLKKKKSPETTMGPWSAARPSSVSPSCPSSPRVCLGWQDPTTNRVFPLTPWPAEVAGGSGGPDRQFLLLAWDCLLEKEARKKREHDLRAFGGHMHSQIDGSQRNASHFFSDRWCEPSWHLRRASTLKNVQ